MKGYKALSMDMKAINGNGMQYEVGKLYSIKGEVILCEKGYHFCTSIEELNGYYSIKNSRIFEAEVYGKIMGRDSIFVAEKMKLVRELTKEEIHDYFKQNQEELIKSTVPDVRKAVAEQGYGLEVLIYDESPYVREAVAKQGYGLDMLIHDEIWFVRMAVAEQGYGLDTLIYDKNTCVRMAIAKQGYGLDMLICDENHNVRKTVAAQGYRLDSLLYDKHWSVRKEVAEQGYGLDILVNDSDKDVRCAARLTAMGNKDKLKKALA